MNIHLKTAIANIRRSPFQVFSAFLVLTVTFFIVTLVSVLLYSSGKVLTYFESRPQVIAFLKNGVKTEAVSDLQNKLLSDVRVKDLKFVSKEEALSIYKDATSDNPLLAELVSPSVFPASIEFSLTDLSYTEKIITDLKADPIVDQVGFTASIGGESTLQDTVSRLKTAVYYLKIGGIVLTAILVATSLLVLTVIISMRLIIRRREVEVLSLIGATPGFLRSPMIIEAVIYALIGVFVGWLVACALVLYGAPALIYYFKDIPILPKSTSGMLGLMGIIFSGELVIGLLLALVGGSLAIGRSTKQK